NNFFGKSKEGSFKYHEVGMGTSIRPLSDLQFSAQILSRRAGAGDRGKVRLDYGFMDYRLVSKASNDFGIRIGRMQNPIGLYNDTPRDVAFTRPSIFLPQSIYFDRTQNLARSSDGLHLYTDHRTGIGDFFYVLGAVYTNVDDQETKRVMLSELPGDLESRLTYATRLMFEQDGGRVRLAITGLLLNVRFKSATSPQKRGEIRFRPLIISAQYNAELWSLSSEYALRNLRYRNVGPLNFNITGESYYLQGTYRLFKTLELLLRYDVTFQDKKDRKGKAFAASTGRPNHSRFAKDATIGLRWDITKTLMSRIEYHIVDGTAWLPLLDNPPPAPTKRYWDLFSVLISFRF
ncbi:hypothetical protein MNBD_NITROSPIRAE01-1066, partial [hydrothermal vent metagenome]